MEELTDPVWDDFEKSVIDTESSVKKIRTVNANRSRDKDDVKLLAKQYFRNIRLALVDLEVDSTRIDSLDRDFKSLLKLASGNSPLATYKNILQSIKRNVSALAAERELLHSRGVAASKMADDVRAYTPLEQAILRTLSELAPSAAKSYEQALIDIRSGTRVSYRGVANELRECLRDTLNVLAPDSDVMKQEGFKLEKDRDKPTMKQKSKYILKARGVPKTAMKVPESAIQVVEEVVPSMARGVYDRASISAHTDRTREEAVTAKRYLESVLADLLQIDYSI